MNITFIEGRTYLQLFLYNSCEFWLFCVRIENIFRLCLLHFGSSLQIHIRQKNMYFLKNQKVIILLCLLKNNIPD